MKIRIHSYNQLLLLHHKENELEQYLKRHQYVSRENIQWNSSNKWSYQPMDHKGNHLDLQVFSCNDHVQSTDHFGEANETVLIFYKIAATCFIIRYLSHFCLKRVYLPNFSGMVFLVKLVFFRSSTTISPKTIIHHLFRTHNFVHTYSTFAKCDRSGLNACLYQRMNSLISSKSARL